MQGEVIEKIRIFFKRNDGYESSLQRIDDLFIVFCFNKHKSKGVRVLFVEKRW